MAKLVQTTKGLDIQISGQAEPKLVKLPIPEDVKIIPDHYPIYPKLSVKAGDKVLAGDPILYDKNHPDVLVTSPVSGEVLAVNRGERRKILDIIIRVDKSIEYKSFEKINLETASAESLKALLQEAGVWSYIKQRPFDEMANPAVTPKAIFVSAYDSAPLAPEYEVIIKGEEPAFQAGLNTLVKLTHGKVYLGSKTGSAFSAFKNVEQVELQGKHPVGNPSVMIQQISPINRGEIVWTVNPLGVLFIGRLLLTGQVDFSKKIALTGPEVNVPQYYQTIIGTDISSIIKDNVATDKHLRYISGNVLTGTQIEADGQVVAADSQLTVIAEGDEQHEVLGWAMLRLHNFSVNRSYFSWLMGKKMTAKFDARLLGGRRALIMSGEYDKVFPFDILPEYLIRAMITKDYDKMENLGIYEVIPEDFALCEYVCTSKMELQKITQEAIEFMKSEME